MIWIEKDKVLTYFIWCPKGDEVTNLKLNAQPVSIPQGKVIRLNNATREDHIEYLLCCKNGWKGKPLGKILYLKNAPKSLIMGHQFSKLPQLSI